MPRKVLTDRMLVGFIVLLLILIAVLQVFVDGGDDEVAPGEPVNTVCFAISADQHYGVAHSSIPVHDAETVEDWMDNPKLPELDFVIPSLGDWISDHRPQNWTNVEYTWAHITACNVDRQRIPYFYVLGNHDIANYEDLTDGNPVRKERVGRSITGLNENNYAFLYDEVLFICAAQTNSLFSLSNYQRGWMEYLTNRYWDRTTVILTHQAMAETTGQGENRSTTWDGADYKVHNDIDWWHQFFDDNPQIVLYVHGHTEKGHNTTVHDLHPEDWDDNCTFVLVPSNGRGTYVPVQDTWSYIFEIGEDFISVRLWDSAYDRFVSDDEVGVPYFRDGLSNGIRDRGMQWFSIPKRVLDGQTWTWDNRMVAEGYSIELVGSNVTEQIDNPDLDGCYDGSEFGGDAKTAYWYAVRGDRFALNTDTGESDGFIEIRGGNLLELATSSTLNKTHIEGKVPYNTAIAVPGMTYEFAARVMTENGKGEITVSVTIPTYLDLWETVWDRETVMPDTVVGREYMWLNATFTVPDDPDSWFIQPSIRFKGNDTFRLDAWSLKMVGEGDLTSDFSVTLNGETHSVEGDLDPEAFETFSLDALTMQNRLFFNCSIGGNRVGIARLIYEGPQLWSDDVSFGIMDADSTIVYIRDVSPFNQLTTVMSFHNATIGIDGFEREVVRSKYTYMDPRANGTIDGAYGLIGVWPPS
jgi:hypothetical protein